MKSLLQAITIIAGVLAAPAFAAEPAGNIAHGKEVFDRWCAMCHTAVKREGRYLVGTASLEMKYKGARPAALEERTDLVAPFVEHVVRHGIVAMPTFRKTEISDAEMHDVAAYLARNLK